MVQNILSAMDSDEVNSIGDTIESLQVAEVLKETYFELFTNADIPEHRALVQLESVSDVNRPNYLKIPDSVRKILWVKYDDRSEDKTNYKELIPLPPHSFFDYTASQAGQANTIEVVTENGIRLYVGSNRQPTYWTSFDDNYIITDSYDADIESTLQQSKSLAYVQKELSWQTEDDFIPLLDANMFPQLLAEAKNTCFVNFKQTANQNEQRKAFRQRVKSQNDQFRAAVRRPIDRLPNYGRQR
jgi:hypothetical protein